MERKRILFISSWFPNKIEPTNGNFVQRHAEAVSLSCDVEILHAIGNFEQEEQYVYDYRVINNIRTLIIYYKNSKNPVQNFVRRMRAYLKGFAKVSRPDLVHANVLHNNMLFAVYLKKKYKIPFVVTEHWTALQKQNLSKTSDSIKRIAKYIAKNAEYILPVSYNLKDSLKQLGITTSMKVISNVVDTDVFTIKPKTGIADHVKFLHVSSLIPRKRPQDIIRAVHLLHQNGFPVSLEIGGDGDSESLDALVKNLGAEKYINVFDAISYAEVAEKMQNSDYFILFSENETQGCVILESYACGKPVISTLVGGAAEFIIEGLGVGVEKDNTDQLYQVLEKICRKGYAFKSESEIRGFSVDRYSRKAIAEQFTEVYNEVLSKNKLS
ncbi:glycosyltransferase [Chryseobacterium sp. BIGb0232]|uniref:glycosyltransferase n=1 Tax=Chryseobacterium sp. BIGb0232 TaxID=2940598 RepID=UPI000F49113D|nr:glycosyltransferase [Chryseobacterium sp. BIGb0232]MCS4303628.1 glycosyltransferase involved in cell wall biosynthesis [Chryseobacterium sp. BIGb0232]ROS10327.1 glycosyltransferase involved in cell wall biosynthesis [Chryseobacterium nakagawai]